MVVADISEGELVRRIVSRLGTSRAIVGPGDDAAVVAAPGGSVVVTTDTLVHGPDFRLAWTSGHDLGFKAAAVNLADIAGMGATPTCLVVALALPPSTPVSFVEQVADGFRDACAALAPACAVEGGDVTSSDTLTVAVTALGDLGGRPPLLRSGARVGDVLALAGDTGLAAAGLAILFDRFRVDGKPMPVREEELTQSESRAVSAQLAPHPPIALGVVANAAGAHALMDVSDGLVLDARRMADASGVTLDIERARLDPANDISLRGGEDHALLAAFAPTAVVPEGFRVIGTVRPRGQASVSVDGIPEEGPGGWDPYRDWDGVIG